MDLNDYQKMAMKFRGFGVAKEIPYAAIGLAGEAGEVADKIKKVLRDNSGIFDDLRKIEIAKEIGDVCGTAPCCPTTSDMILTS